MNPLKRVHFEPEHSKRQRIEPEEASKKTTSILIGRNVTPVRASLVFDEKWSGVFKIIMEFGAVYEGEIVNGLQHGKGKTTLWSGALRHEGEYLNGQFHGYGRGNFNGYFYVGDFRHNKFDGYGAIYNKDGELEYEGYWVEGRRYVGQIKDHKPHGSGFTYNSDGTKHDSGEWKEGVFQASSDKPLE